MGILFQQGIMCFSENMVWAARETFDLEGTAGRGIERILCMVRIFIGVGDQGFKIYRLISRTGINSRRSQAPPVCYIPPSTNTLYIS